MIKMCHAIYCHWLTCDGWGEGNTVSDVARRYRTPCFRLGKGRGDTLPNASLSADWRKHGHCLHSLVSSRFYFVGSMRNLLGICLV